MTKRLSGNQTIRRKLIHINQKTSIGMFSDWVNGNGVVWELPFETLYGNKIDNLITAGRNISADDDIWDLTRVIPVCAISGQAAGTPAAMGDNFSKINISELQDRLVQAGVVLHENNL